MLILNHLLIYSQTFFICLFLSLNGFLFKKIILDFNDNKNFEENSLFGFLLIGFIALFINFFYPLSLFLNNIFFLLMAYYAFKLGFFNQNKKNLLKKAIYVSSFSYFLFIYSNVNTPDGRTITVQPWEKSLMQEIEKAIINANLGFNPMNNGENIIINVPPLTEERRKDLVKQARGEAEDAKIGVRNDRKNANNDIKKAEDASEDEKANAEVDIQKLTDIHIKKIEEVLSKKEAEIMTV